MSVEEYSEGSGNHNDDAQKITQEILKALSVSPETLAKIKEFKISFVPVVTYQVDITIVPEK
jgi:hypothetical protein